MAARQPSVEGRVPLNLLRHMLDNGLLRPGYGTLRGHVMVNWHAADAPLLTTRPWLLAFSTEESGKDMGLLRSAIGERRIDEGIAKAEAFLEKNHLALVVTRAWFPWAAVKTASRN